MPTLDVHNGSQLDLAGQTLIGLGRRAVTEKPHGALVIRIEWRDHAFSRLATNIEGSELLPAFKPSK